MELGARISLGEGLDLSLKPDSWFRLKLRLRDVKLHLRLDCGLSGLWFPSPSGVGSEQSPGRELAGDTQQGQTCPLAEPKLHPCCSSLLWILYLTPPSHLPWPPTPHMRTHPVVGSRDPCMRPLGKLWHCRSLASAGNGLHRTDWALGKSESAPRQAQGWVGGGGGGSGCTPPEPDYPESPRATGFRNLGLCINCPP